jgi:tRNA 2-thiouridine synthesizing protein A
VADVKEDTVLDCRGLQCPMPVVRVSREMSTLVPGQILKVLATDRGALADLPAWAGDTGNEVLEWYDDGSYLVFYVRKGSDAGQ